MSLERSDEDFVEELSSSIKRAIHAIPEFIQNEIVYGLALYTSVEFTSFSLALNTEETLTRRQTEQLGLDVELLKMIQDHPDLLSMAKNHEIPDDYLRVVADEWGYMGIAEGEFRTINEWAIDRYEKRSESDQRLDEKSNLVMCGKALQAVRNSDPFKSDCFANDVLLCVQYSDLSDNEPELLELAMKLNSAEWNKTLRTVWSHGTGRT